MIGNYGYKDGSGEFYISLDSDKCNSCKKCVEECPEQVLEMICNDYDEIVPIVRDDHRKKIKFSCAPCKPLNQKTTPICVKICDQNAIWHSW